MSSFDYVSLSNDVYDILLAKAGNIKYQLFPENWQTKCLDCRMKTIKLLTLGIIDGNQYIHDFDGEIIASNYFYTNRRNYVTFKVIYTNGRIKDIIYESNEENSSGD